MRGSLINVHLLFIFKLLASLCSLMRTNRVKSNQYALIIVYEVYNFIMYIFPQGRNIWLRRLQILLEGS